MKENNNFFENHIDVVTPVYDPDLSIEDVSVLSEALGITPGDVMTIMVSESISSEVKSMIVDSALSTEYQM